VYDEEMNKNQTRILYGTFIVFLIFICVSCDREEDNSFSAENAYTVKEFWLNLDQCAKKDIVIYGKIHWISPDKTWLDLFDGQENISVVFPDFSFLEKAKLGQTVYIEGFVDCPSVQKGKIDKFVHNAFIQGKSIRKAP
jgi:hypothetical protein